MKKGMKILLAALFVAVLAVVLYIIIFDPSIFSIRKLDRSLLNRTLALGRSFLLNNQKPGGNFAYEYNFATGEDSKDDNQVRQAGALWGMALIHHDSPSAGTLRAVLRGIDFFTTNSVITSDGRRFINYPGDRTGKTGTVALVCLAITDFLRSDVPAGEAARLKKLLGEYMAQLMSLRMGDGRFYMGYSQGAGKGHGSPSPYFDGESLLAMVKAASYPGHGGLRSRAIESAESMYNHNVLKAQKRDRDSSTTKGFYQWGSMAFLEMYLAGWGDKYAQWTIELAYWMIDVHRVLHRTRNTAYAFEGLASAREAARLTGNNEAADYFGRVVSKGLYKLITWQVGNPVKNMYLAIRSTRDPRAVGGIMNSMADPNLRIDVAQHQVHAVILARRYIFRDEP